MMSTVLVSSSGQRRARRPGCRCRYRAALQILPGLVATLVALAPMPALSTESKPGAAPFDSFYCVRYLLQLPRDRTDTYEFHFDKKIVDDILAARHTTPVNLPPFKIKNETFTPYSFIGRGSSRAYLATNSRGEHVVVKQLYIIERDFLQEYEVAVTEYYKSLGIDVPEIVAYDFDQYLVVKKYEEGLTYQEISKHEDALLGKDAAAATAITTTLIAEQLALDWKHRDFGAWLLDHRPSLYDRLKRKWWFLIERGDHQKAENFIFSLKKGRWVLIDP